MTSLNPTIKIYEQLIEPLLWHNLTNKEKAKIYALQMLKKVGIPDPQKRLFSYPFQFSGGMKQRIMIAMALICKPKLLIADEPTTALDVTIRAQILNLLQDMRKEFKMSVIMITHDFSIALNFCDRIIVMYAGKIVESAPSSTFIKNPKHPYSLGLLNSTLDIETTEKKLTPIKGMPPDLINPPSGCRFHPRCQYATKKCEKEVPELKEIEKNHFVACHLF
jgi:oligopeptide/dipeptide ABC transporter ATP-binding protein